MHQEGNKSGAHRESICFHLHGRTARIESRRGEAGRKEGGGRKRRTLDEGKGHEEDGDERRERESFRAKGPRNPASYLWNGY